MLSKVKKEWRVGFGFGEYVRRGGGGGERGRKRESERLSGELVQYFDNGYPWKEPNHSSGHWGGWGVVCREEEKGMKTKSAKRKNVHSGMS